jgi:alkylation response protein AidB-like acyl-CoA dehydrogenase
MSTYSAPLDDIGFVLREIAGIGDIASLPEYAHASDDVVSAVLGEAARFARDVLDPLNAIGDREPVRLEDGHVAVPDGFAKAYRQFVAAGWNGLAAPPEYGGQGLPRVVDMAAQEMWNSANLSFCLAPMLTSGVVHALLRHASEAQQRLYLPKLVSGEWCGTMNLTESQAGSDLSAVRTQAVPQGSHYRIRGTKVFITWGEHDMAENIVHLVLARTPDAPEGVKGISLFVVPRRLAAGDGSLGERNDITCVSVERKLGIHASPTCMLAYGEHGGAIGYLVGERNRGLEYMFTTMNHARLGVGIEGIGVAERAYQHALDYAKTRIQGRAIGQRSGDRVPIVQHPDVRRMLLSMKAQVEAMRATAYYTAAVLDFAHAHPDAGERDRQHAVADLLTPVVKGWCTEQAIEIASTGIQVHGGMGYVEEAGAAQYLRDARITAIYEGTTGIQANDLVGRKIARDGGHVALQFIGAMREAGDALAGAETALQRLRSPLLRAVSALEAATRWIAAATPARAAAVAVPYLKLFGTVTAGWLMARAALAAVERAPNGAFRRDKVTSVSFYAQHVLPFAEAYAALVREGADGVLAFRPDDMEE